VEFTGERYVPELDAPDISYEHWHRYLFAAQFANGKTVLDIASGEGYGSALLARTAQRVVGVDLDQEAVKHAAAKYPLANLEFRRGTIGEIPVEGSHVFDVIVSFETIEHVEEEQQLRFGAEVKRLLKSQGVLLVSTPDKLFYSDRTGHRNEFHHREFYRDSFLSFLRRYFKSVKLLGQKVYPASYIWPLGAPPGPVNEHQLGFRDGGFSPVEGDRKEALFLVAVCTDSDSGAEPAGVPQAAGGSLLIDTSDRRVAALYEQLQGRERMIEDLRVQAGEARARAEAATITSERLQVAERELAALRQESQALRTEVAAGRTSIEALRADIERQRRDSLDSVLKLIADWREEARQRENQILRSIDETRTHSPAASVARTPPQKFDAGRYRELVERVREVVASQTPVNSIVAVVSKGDPELVRLPGRRGWHFPQRHDGIYAGHYPADSSAAIGHLAQLRAKGAQYLLFPATAFWWMEHYRQFAEHLESRHAVVHNDDTCMLYALAASGAPAVPAGAAKPDSDPAYDGLQRRIRELVDNLLPENVTISVLSKGEEELLSLGRRKAWHFPRAADGTYVGYHPADDVEAVAQLEQARSDGSEYLLIPATSSWWLDHYAAFGRYLSDRCRVITRQQYVCQIFQLPGQPAAASAPSAGRSQKHGTNGQQRPARAGGIRRRSQVQGG